MNASATYTVLLTVPGTTMTAYGEILLAVDR